ncbi:hypothetical protein GR927_32150 [Mycolicibacterium sp. 3033]|nr:hypothetical protein [Mycolicibacterium aurantiacum]
MGEPSLRAAALAGLVSAGLLIAGPGAAPAVAQPSDSGTSSQGSDSAGDGPGEDSTASKADADDSAGDDDGDVGETGDSDPPTIRSDALDDAAESGDFDGDTLVPIDDEDTGSERDGSSRGPLPPSKTPRMFDYSNSSITMRIPVPRLPAADEIPAGTWPTVSSFYTTVEVSVPTLQGFLQSLVVNPTPAPPGPSIRTQEEEPVVDAATGTTTAGGGGGGVMSEAPVMRAPLVVAVPRVATVGGQGARPVEAVAAPAPGVTAPGTAGVRTPVIRGSLPPSAESAPQSVSTPLSGPPPRLGYPRALTNPTLAELAAVALPGVAGLLLLTFGGGVIGYRQANSLRYVRTPGAERFLP